MTAPFVTQPPRFREEVGRFYDYYSTLLGRPLSDRAGSLDFSDVLGGASTTSAMPDFSDVIAGASGSGVEPRVGLAEMLYKGLGSTALMNRHELIGAARAYGIEFPERIPADSLRVLINDQRHLQSLSRWQPSNQEEIVQLQDNIVKTILASTGKSIAGFFASLTDFAQEIDLGRITGIGEPEAVERIDSLPSKMLRGTEEWFSTLQENSRRNLTADIQEHADAAAAAAYAVGMLPLGAQLYRAVGLGLQATPWISAMSPLAKAGATGALTTHMMLGGSEMPALPHSGDIRAIGDPEADQLNAAARVVFGNRTGAALFGGALAMGFHQLYSLLNNSSATRTFRPRADGGVEVGTVPPDLPPTVPQRALAAPRRLIGAPRGPDAPTRTVTAAAQAQSDVVVGTVAADEPALFRGLRVQSDPLPDNYYRLSARKPTESNPNELFYIVPQPDMPGASQVANASSAIIGLAEAYAARPASRQAILNVLDRVLTSAESVAPETLGPLTEQFNDAVTWFGGEPLTAQQGGAPQALSPNEMPAPPQQVEGPFNPLAGIRPSVALPEEEQSLLDLIASTPDLPESTRQVIADRDFDQLYAEQLQSALTPVGSLLKHLNVGIKHAETGEPLKVVTGTSATFENPDVARSSVGNLIGPAIYTTDYPTVSGGDPAAIALDPFEQKAVHEGYAFIGKGRNEATRNYLNTKLAELATELSVVENGRRSVTAETYRELKSRVENEIFATKQELEDLDWAAPNLQPYYMASQRMLHFDTDQFDYDQTIGFLQAVADELPVQSEEITRVTRSLSELAASQQNGVPFSNAMETTLGLEVMTEQATDSWPVGSIYGLTYSWMKIGKDILNKALLRLGYDVVEYRGGRGIFSTTKHRAFAVLDPSVLVPAYGGEQLLGSLASAYGIQLAKQAVVIDSPTAPEVAGHSEVTDEDVLEAKITRTPGGITALRGIADPGELLAKLSNGEVEWGGIAPGDWRIVEHEGRLDLLVSTGRKLDATDTEYYSKYGLVKDMIVTVVKQGGTAERRVVVGITEGKTEPLVLVAKTGAEGYGRQRGGQFGLRPYKVKISKVMFTEDSESMLEVPDIWERFFSGMEARAQELGYDDWQQLSRSEVSDIFERTLDEIGIKSPTIRAGIRNTVDQQFVKLHMEQEPDLNEMLAGIEEEIAAVEALNEAAPGEINKLEVIHSMAAARGFRAASDPDRADGVILGDTMSPNLFEMSEDDAIAFLREFSRDVPDVDPGGQVPIEVAGSVRPDNDPVAPPTTGTQTKRKRRSAAATARTVEGQPEPEAPSEPPSSALAELVPDSPLPPVHGGGDGPPIWSIANAAKHEGDFNAMFNRAMVRSILPVRNIMADLEELFTTIGSPELRPRVAFEEVSAGLDRAHNSVYQWHRDVHSAIQLISSRLITSGKAWKVWAADGAQREQLLRDTEASDTERRSFEQLDELFEELAPGLKPELVRFVNEHSLAQQLGKKNFQSSATGIDFYADNAKEHFVDFRFPDLPSILHNFARAYSFSLYVSAPWDRAMKTWRAVQNYTDSLGRKPLHAPGKLVVDWLDTVKYGPSTEHDAALTFVHTTFNATLGRVIGPITRSEASSIINGTLSNIYRAVQGFRLYPIVRDSLQPLLSLPWVGTRNLALAYHVLLRGPAKQRDQIIEDLIEMGVWQKGVPPVTSGLIQEEQLKRDVEIGFSNEQTQVRDLRRKVGGILRDMLPPWLRGVQGTMLDPMWLYTNTGAFNRIIVGTAAIKRFDQLVGEYLEAQRAIASSAKPPSQALTARGQLSQLLNRLGTSGFDMAVQRMISDAFENGQVEYARQLYVRAVADMTQFRYGVRELNPSWRSHTARVGMQLGNYSSQLLGLLHSARRGTLANANTRIWRRLLMTIGAVSAGAYLAQKKTGMPFLKFSFLNPTGYWGGPLVEPVSSGFVAARGVASELGGYNPSAEELMARERFASSFGLSQMLRMLNPTQGLIDNAQAIDAIARSDRPAEAAASWFLAGERRVDAPYFRRLYDRSVGLPDSGGTGAMQ